jgi:hypothetical protein
MDSWCGHWNIKFNEEKTEAIYSITAEWFRLILK